MTQHYNSTQLDVLRRAHLLVKGGSFKDSEEGRKKAAALLSEAQKYDIHLSHIGWTLNLNEKEIQGLLSPQNPVVVKEVEEKVTHHMQEGVRMKTKGWNSRVKDLLQEKAGLSRHEYLKRAYILIHESKDEDKTALSKKFGLNVDLHVNRALRWDPNAKPNPDLDDKAWSSWVSHVELFHGSYPDEARNPGGENHKEWIKDAKALILDGRTLGLSVPMLSYYAFISDPVVTRFLKEDSVFESTPSPKAQSKRELWVKDVEEVIGSDLPRKDKIIQRVNLLVEADRLGLSQRDIKRLNIRCQADVLKWAGEFKDPTCTEGNWIQKALEHIEDPPAMYLHGSDKVKYIERRDTLFREGVNLGLTQSFVAFCMSSSMETLRAVLVTPKKEEVEFKEVTPIKEVNVPTMNQEATPVQEVSTPVRKTGKKKPVITLEGEGRKIHVFDKKIARLIVRDFLNGQGS